MKVVTLCGSMRFYHAIQEIAMELETKHGYCVLVPIGGNVTPPDQDALKKLAEAHYRKIDLSDAVYIVNIGGYIGESVSREIEYAREHGKEIIFHEPNH